MPRFCALILSYAQIFVRYTQRNTSQTSQEKNSIPRKKYPLWSWRKKRRFWWERWEISKSKSLWLLPEQFPINFCLEFRALEGASLAKVHHNSKRKSRMHVLCQRPPTPLSVSQVEVRKFVFFCRTSRNPSICSFWQSFFSHRCFLTPHKKRTCAQTCICRRIKRT